MLLEINFFIQKKKKKKRKSNQIKIKLSLGYHHSYFYKKRCNIICYSDGYHFLDKEWICTQNNNNNNI